MTNFYIKPLTKPSLDMPTPVISEKREKRRKVLAGVYKRRAQMYQGWLKRAMRDQD